MNIRDVPWTAFAIIQAEDVVGYSHAILGSLTSKEAVGRHRLRSTTSKAHTGGCCMSKPLSSNAAGSERLSKSQLGVR
jgi:hypothetical protein